MPLVIIGCVAGVCLLFLLGLTLYIYFAAFGRGNNRGDAATYRIMTGEEYERYKETIHSLIDGAKKIPFDPVYTESYDGLRLFGRIYYRKEGAPFHILFHGYRGNGIRDFSGGLGLALETGDNVLLVDHRAHGESEGRTITFGAKESRDVLTWIDYILDRYGKGTPVYLCGVSMGAATVLTAGGLDLPPEVRGIFADCPYSSPYEIISKTAREMSPLGKLAGPFIRLSARVFGGFDVDSASAIASAPKLKVPVTIIHGKADSFVPTEMSRRIREANPEMIKLVEVDNAPHGMSFLENKELYVKVFAEHLERCGRSASELNSIL
ncbi:MAG: alpha/beta hydrolase [Clostridia bacterium]|nr:alpha/beta hydrolase [Clostridia bacterium]